MFRSSLINAGLFTFLILANVFIWHIPWMPVHLNVFIVWVSLSCVPWLIYSSLSAATALDTDAKREPSIKSRSIACLAVMLTTLEFGGAMYLLGAYLLSLAFLYADFPMLVWLCFDRLFL